MGVVVSRVSFGLGLGIALSHVSNVLCSCMFKTNITISQV